MENIILPEEVIRKKYVRSVESTIPSTILQRLQLYKST